MCDDDFFIYVVYVVCWELGYVEVKFWIVSFFYGKGEGFIWLDNFYCIGNEVIFVVCIFNGWGVIDCKYMEDVGVVCSDKRIFGFKFDNLLIN